MRAIGLGGTNRALWPKAWKLLKIALVRDVDEESLCNRSA